MIYGETVSDADPGDAVRVRIGGEVFRVVGARLGQGRGREYQLAKDDGLIHRVCYAPPKGSRIVHATAHGSRLIYEYRK